MTSCSSIVRFVASSCSFLGGLGERWCMEDDLTGQVTKSKALAFWLLDPPLASPENELNGVSPSRWNHNEPHAART